MAINRVEIKNFLVFKGEFAIDFCPGVNVIIGENGTGKTTLLKCLYNLKRSNLLYPGDVFDIDSVGSFENGINVVNEPKSEVQERKWGKAFLNGVTRDFVYIPEKDILEHAKGLLPFIERKHTGFSQIYKDAIVSAQDIPTIKQTALQKRIGGLIADIVGGYIEWVQSEGTFYTVRTDGMRIPFSLEASGFKKLGYLGLLIASGQLDTGTVLFWDEPENSLNPELISILVDILLELSRNDIQILLATHSEILASYFSVNRKRNDAVMFHSLYRESEFIIDESNDRFDLLDNNKLFSEPVKLYKKQLGRGLSGNG